MSFSIVAGRPPESETEIRARLRMTAESESLHNLCARLKNERHYEAALVAARRAVAFAPHCGAHRNAVGSTLWCLGRFAEARDALLDALELGYDEIGTLSNLAGCYASLGDYDKADEWFLRALGKDPNHLHVRYDRSMSFLDSGRWEKGFEDYDVRFDFRGRELYPKMPYPTWKGEPLDGKTLFVQFEQGAGDRILFSRYLAEIHRRWPTCRLIVLAGEELVSLLWAFAHVEWVPKGVPWPENVDFGAYLMSLPGRLGTTPERVPADPGLIRKRAEQLSPSVRLSTVAPGCLRVGVAWSGNPEMLRNVDRSIPLEMIAELEELAQVQLYSLQVGPPAADIDRLGARPLIEDLSPMLRSHGYVGTAAVMLNLDLVVTACTSVAHLAGALGVPTWVMLCRDPYWVWLREREDSPWYPSVRLFRQTDQGDWRPVIDRVKRELRHLAERPSSLAKEAIRG